MPFKGDCDGSDVYGRRRQADVENPTPKTTISLSNGSAVVMKTVQVMSLLLLVLFTSSLLSIELCIGRSPRQPQQVAVLTFTNPN